MERELRELDEKRLEDEAKIEAQTKRFEFETKEKGPIAIPANRHTVETLDYGYLKPDQVSMKGDSIFMKVKSNRFDEDSTFIDFAVATSLLTDKSEDIQTDKQDSSTKEKPLFLVLDNGTQTLVLHYAYFKFVEGDEDENYGSLKGYLFK